MGENGEPSGDYTLAKRNFTPLWRLFYDPNKTYPLYEGPYRGPYQGLGHSGGSGIGTFDHPINGLIGRGGFGAPQEGLWHFKDMEAWIRYKDNKKYMDAKLFRFVNWMKSFEKK